MLVVRNLVFYLCFLAFGLEPTGYFVVAVATHVAVSLGVGALARRLTGDALLGCFAGVLFAVAPANHGTLGWQSAFGHALAAAAVLAGLLVIAPRPGDGSALSPRAAACAALAMLVASQCFGTGAAAALVFPLVAVLLRPATLSSPLPCAILRRSRSSSFWPGSTMPACSFVDPAGIQTAKVFARARPATSATSGWWRCTWPGWVSSTSCWGCRSRRRATGTCFRWRPARSSASPCQ